MSTLLWISCRRPRNCRLGVLILRHVLYSALERSLRFRTPAGTVAQTQHHQHLCSLLRYFIRILDMILFILLLWVHFWVWSNVNSFMIVCNSKCGEPLFSNTVHLKAKPDSTIHAGQEKLDSSIGILTTQDSMSFRPLRLSSSSFETDFLGMINFCLRTVDNTLSGPSRSKVLNEISNDVFKAIVIGYQPLIHDTVEKFAAYRAIVGKTECKLDKFVDGAPPVIDNCDLDLELSLIYINWLEDLITNGVANVRKCAILLFCAHVHV